MRTITLSALFLLLCSNPCSGGQSTTGTIDVPGPGKLSYKVTARKVPNTASHISFWLDLINEEDFPITIITCAMIRLDLDEIMMPQFEVEKTGGNWVCTPMGMINRPPGFHFGCKEVTVPANGTEQAFDVTRDVGIPFTQEQISSVYWDVLEACPLVGCDQFDTANVNLTPATADIITNSANIWGGDWWGPECLTCLDFKEAFWDVGNWLTMELLGFYPARQLGTITGAPPGSTFELTLPGPIVETFVVPQSGIVDVDVPFIIPPDPSAVATLKFVASEPLPEGLVVRYAVSVVAEPGNAVYDVGQEMYRVAMNFVQDTVPPEIVSTVVTPAADFLNFVIASSDSSTMAAAASVSISVDGGADEVFPLEFGSPAFDGFQTIFEEELGPFRFGSSVTYQFSVVDEIGNVEISGPEKLIICQPVVPSGSVTSDVVGPQNGFVASVDASATVGTDPSFAWDFDGDGVADATNATATFKYTDPGTFQITLTAANVCSAASVDVGRVTSVLIGDFNADGSLELSDAVDLANFLFVPGTTPPFCAAATDFNGGGTLNLIDVVGNLNFQFVGGPAAVLPQNGTACDDVP